MTTLVAVGYATTPLPTATQKGVKDQGSTVYYADQKHTPIERLGANREILKPEQIPQVVKDAVVAIEDRGFYTESGVSPRGIARALYNNISGGDTQGASTITQQLARNYYAALSQDRSVSRKFKEIFISIKLSEKKSKEEILDLYLNTVLFGRQSSGIGMAAHRYFHKTAAQLTVGEAAMLAALIQRPNYFHTQGNDPRALALKDRWQTVIKNMVAGGKLTQTDADKALAKYPRTSATWSDTKDTQQTVYLKQRIDEELSQIKGLTPDQIATGGYKIYTSIDPDWMKFAQAAMNEKGIKAWPKNIGTGLVAVDPATGEIKAFYGGEPKRNGAYDTVFNPSAQVGSSFKPYVLATALKNNFSIKSMIDGHSPQNFDGLGNNLPLGQKGGYLVHNDAGDGKMGVITLVKATEMSVNTAYVKLNLLMKPQEVAKTAEDFGVPATYLNKFDNQGGLALGIANIPAVYQAAGYAAFANNGTAITPHLITKIVDASGKSIPLPWRSHRVLTEDQAAQATVAMRAVVTTGTGKRANIPGRPVAGKTGTTEGNVAAWFVGYTPQLSAAVTMFSTKNKTMTNIPGFQGKSVYGGTIPAEIWKSFMMKVADKAKWAPKDFKTPTYDGSIKQLWDTPKATPTQTSAAPSPTTTPPCQGNGNGHGHGQGQPCPNSSSPSTTTSPGAGQPCDRFNMPLNCDQDKPPSTPPPNWWCTSYKSRHGTDYPGCSTKSTGPPVGGKKTGALGVSQPPARTEE
jgi:membrane peptidoglycan carboxypeptidase